MCLATATAATAATAHEQRNQNDQTKTKATNDEDFHRHATPNLYQKNFYYFCCDMIEIKQSDRRYPSRLSACDDIQSQADVDNSANNNIDVLTTDPIEETATDHNQRHNNRGTNQPRQPVHCLLDDGRCTHRRQDQ